MRRHGWAGDIPADDDEAVRRIISTARQAIDARGTVSVSEVAQSLGVTRQTVYRYFPTVESLMVATAVSSVDGFLDRLAAELGAITDPSDAVVEGIAYTAEQIPHDRYLSLVLQPGKASAFTAGVTSDLAIEFGKSILRRFDIDWAAVGFDDEVFDQLVEFMLRTLQSFIVDPGGPSRHDTGLRAYLRDWVAPAVAAHTH
ncbi:TetR family transcriptional regulator [Mycolicibacterium conceptionense]|jgi:AcrR family transcriptional regulator|uniref:TetR family transcriptional regulator n=3 Tax=Mycolicibacterium TaxID=1866885 RepID=A0A0J8U9Z4_9MYCO|nr:MULTISPECIES: TetR/AcrR family transcriptional regulator [Mycolicibacterium]KLI06938.1 TetR family transcriptional regulator [Mycolicibacterium senegalense]KLO52457.1 TetR family transcriptional regulator [Mycolicibacterium senegalense]KMV17822.1 TetR family transcriptional regulator [Mycolicibacterium conceptionense]OMB88415.1 TetR family transcriptional regulator [Mycolicibacterium conceptionense]ORV31581.1 TetR family transcriptional regulator [Mycolicibacterium conceptionense]